MRVELKTGSYSMAVTRVIIIKSRTFYSRYSLEMTGLSIAPTNVPRSRNRGFVFKIITAFVLVSFLGHDLAYAAEHSVSNLLQKNQDRQTLGFLPSHLKERQTNRETMIQNKNRLSEASPVITTGTTTKTVEQFTGNIMTYSYDANKHLTQSVTTNSAGKVLSTASYKAGLDNKDLLTQSTDHLTGNVTSFTYLPDSNTPTTSTTKNREGLVLSTADYKAGLNNKGLITQSTDSLTGNVTSFVYLPNSNALLTSTTKNRDGRVISINDISTLTTHLTTPQSLDRGTSAGAAESPVVSSDQRANLSPISSFVRDMTSIQDLANKSLSNGDVRTMTTHLTNDQLARDTNQLKNFAVSFGLTFGLTLTDSEISDIASNLTADQRSNLYQANNGFTNDLNKLEDSAIRTNTIYTSTEIFGIALNLTALQRSNLNQANNGFANDLSAIQALVVQTGTPLSKKEIFLWALGLDSTGRASLPLVKDTNQLINSAASFGLTLTETEILDIASSLTALQRSNLNQANNGFANDLSAIQASAAKLGASLSKKEVFLTALNLTSVQRTDLYPTSSPPPPSDPSNQNQHGRQSGRWYLDAIGVGPNVWNSRRGQGVTIAVIDSGVDIRHPDLSGNVLNGRDYVDGDSDPGNNSFRHGTAVTGIIHTIAPDAKILPLRVFDEIAMGVIKPGSFADRVRDGIHRAADTVRNGVTEVANAVWNGVRSVASSAFRALDDLSGGKLSKTVDSVRDFLIEVGIDVLDFVNRVLPGLLPDKVDLLLNGIKVAKHVVEAMDFAVSQGVNIINLSMGAPHVNSLVDAISRKLRDRVQGAVDNAVNHGVFVVAAAMNEGANVDEVWPANLRGVIAVGATQPGNTIAPFSNIGSSIDFVAPGVDITLTDAAGGHHNLGGGTSFATPMVSAAIALLINQYPGESPSSIINRLERAAIDLGKPGWDPVYGHGLLNIAHSLKLSPSVGMMPNLTADQLAKDTNQLKNSAASFGLNLTDSEISDIASNLTAESRANLYQTNNGFANNLNKIQASAARFGSSLSKKELFLMALTVTATGRNNLNHGWV